ncbi:MAG: SusD/RagB family nutrient-binding outer membrane lipoprotein [Prevotellaceae bacterium]|nr:SusD/RagB family nutrient-binding outer membrane lipoprotein [Prevotellaceae bacterium]
MKNIKKLTLFITIMTCMTACTADFIETNTNPNGFSVGSAKPSNMFVPILAGGANDWTYSTWFWNNELIQYTTFAGGTTRNENIYSIADGNWANRWNFYAAKANNANHMYQLAQRDNDDIFKALALTWKVFYMSELASMFGDIPYSEAFQANIGNMKPKFDTQKEVFEQMFAELEQANILYQSDSPYFSASIDNMYGANLTKWRKFNNSLYLRLLMRVSGRNDELPVVAKIQEILNNPLTYPVFESNADNAKCVFSGTAPYLYYFNRVDYDESSFTSAGRHLTEQIIKMTVFDGGAYVDPRLPVYGVMRSGGWKGAVAGCPIGERTTSGVARLNYEVFVRNDGDYIFMDYAEVQFIFAEAAFKGFISGGKDAAKNYYENAVTASIEKWAGYGKYMTVPHVIASADITAFLQRPEVIFDLAKSDADIEELIANQKYIALFWIGMEAWHEYRRTGFPDLIIGTGTLNDHILPTRFAYPNTTMATNSVNANAALQNMNARDNDMKTPMWWSKKAITGNW